MCPAYQATNCRWQQQATFQFQCAQLFLLWHANVETWKLFTRPSLPDMQAMFDDGAYLSLVHQSFIKPFSKNPCRQAFQIEAMSIVQRRQTQLACLFITLCNVHSRF